MHEDDIVTADGMPLLRRSVWRSLVLTNLKLLCLGMLGGAAFGVAVYFLLKFRNAADLTLAIVLGVLMAASALPAIVHWTRHFSALLRQLSEIEARVKNGEIIHASELRFRSYR